MGWPSKLGKTITTLTAIVDLIDSMVVSKVLIVAPLRVATLEPRRVGLLVVARQLDGRAGGAVFALDLFLKNVGGHQRRAVGPSRKLKAGHGVHFWNNSSLLSSI